MRAAVFTTMGASNHADGTREANDFYATHPPAVEKLLEREKFSGMVWECACGQGHVADVLKRHGYTVWASDIVDRGYPGTQIIDFLRHGNTEEVDIITNPPYKHAQEFVEKAMGIVTTGHKVAMLLKLQFLEGQARKEMYAVVEWI